MTKKRRVLIYSVGFILMFVLGITLIHLLASKREDVPLEILLLPTPSFPTNWYTGLDIVSVEWYVWEAAFSQRSGDAYDAKFNLGRSWHRFDEADKLSAPFIKQQIYWYDTPLGASKEYLLSRPEIVYGDAWPNFQLSYNSVNRYPKEWFYDSFFADQEHIVCAMGAPDSCQLWFYWARYGQYILEVSFFAPNQGMNAEVFAQIVASIDGWIGHELKKQSLSHPVYTLS